MRSDSHIGDIGTAFTIQVVDEDGQAIDLSTASLLQIIFKKPSSARLVKTATLTTDGKDGQMQYVSVDGDLDQTGGWQMQPRITIGGSTWSGSVVTFTVASNL